MEYNKCINLYFSPTILKVESNVTFNSFISWLPIRNMGVVTKMAAES